MDIPLSEAVYFDVVTSNPATGAAVDADAPPSFEVFEEATDTDIGVGGNTTKRTDKTGNYRGTFTASVANGFEAGKFYSVVVSATVGGVVGKCVARSFRAITNDPGTSTPQTGDGYAVVSHTDYGNAKLVRSTTPANTLTVDEAHKIAVPDTQKVDVETIKTKAVTCGAAVTVGVYVGNATAAIAVDGSGYVTYANAAPPAASAIATAVWQDATAGDFTAAHSIGLALYIDNKAPGASGGLPTCAGAGYVNAYMTGINATSIAGTSTQVAAAFLVQYNVASPVFTAASVNQTIDAGSSAHYQAMVKEWLDTKIAEGKGLTPRETLQLLTQLVGGGIA